MKSGKRYVLILVALVILCTSTLPANGIAQTIDEKANALNQLNILAGSPANFNLSEKLSRAHAAAFIVRLTGREDHVNKYADIYNITSFPDVDPTQWYAKYVGYCAKEKIIVGTSAGKFEPTGYISEKAFLRLILSALGYIYNEDYPLEQVYTRAYSLGIVTDPSYFNRTEDNTNYTRGQAVDVLYNALKVINKNTGKEMFYSLIDNDAITREAAVKAGLIVDTTITAIEEIKALDFNKVYIKFNENIKPVANENIIMYEHGEDDDLIECDLASLEGNELEIYAPNRGSDKQYVIKLLKVEDEDGNITDEVLGMFSGYELEIEDVESDYFRIKSIEAINEKSIKVLFTHPVNVNSESANRYRIYEDTSIFANGSLGDITVRINSLSDGVLLTLNKKVFNQNRIYTLDIDGELTSAYGVRLNDGEDDSMKFAASSEAVEPFALTDIETYDNNTLLLLFNKDINPFLASQIFNYYITKENGTPIRIESSAAGKASGEGHMLFISIEGTFSKKEKYSLTINNLNDITRQEYIQEEIHSFTADYGSSEEMQIDSVYAADNKTIEVYFETQPDINKAIMANYYTVRGDGFSFSASPEKVYYNANLDPYLVKLYLPDSKKLSKTKDYYLTVDSRMQDYIGNYIGKNIREYFGGTSDSVVPPEIDDAVTISSDAVKLTFDREIALDAPNILTNNYVLEYSVSGIQYRKVPLSVIYINAKTVILKFDSLEEDEDATIKIRYNKLKDYSGIEGAPGEAEVRLGQK
ncbi:MAG: S-layer homology domain-containing protein [Acetivibrionales bacterium]